MDAAIEDDARIHISGISLVEIVYLEKKGRIGPLRQHQLDDALRNQEEFGLRLVPIDGGVAQALRRVPRDVVPDMPDRIIAATALRLGLPLVTKDARIRSLPPETI
jgi:PIN domain nuclease of toxin-antitoxin system